jgi:hypothetical protein
MKWVVCVAMFAVLLLANCDDGKEGVTPSVIPSPIPTPWESISESRKKLSCGEMVYTLLGEDPDVPTCEGLSGSALDLCQGIAALSAQLSFEWNQFFDACIACGPGNADYIEGKGWACP